MGYYTQYELETDDCDTDKHIFALRLETGYSCLFEDECKWYEHEKEMAAYSVNHPAVQFRLSGQGEESGDVWVKWFKAGKMQTWKLEVNKPTPPPEPW
jgi:hypothetical protein